MDSIKNKLVAQIQQRMDEYADEAAAQADAMDVYSLISTEQDFQDDDEYGVGGGGDHGSGAGSSSVGGGAGSVGRFDFVDDIMDGKEVKDPLANKGLGRQLVLHRITADEVAEAFELYGVSQSKANTRTLLASLKYLGINIPRGEMTLILSEITTRVLREDEPISVEQYAFFVKHCFATLDSAWKTYLVQRDDLLENVEDVDVINISEPKPVLFAALKELEALCGNGGGKRSSRTGKSLDDGKEDEGMFMEKCALLSTIYRLMVAPQVENDEVLFEEMMDKLSPVLLSAIREGMHHVLWVQEICIVICRISQFHTVRLASYGRSFYDMLLQLVAFGGGIVSHCSSVTCLVIASMVQFLNVPKAQEMTNALLQSLSLVEEGTSKYDSFRVVVFRCLLASLMRNVPLKKDEQIKQEVIEAIWNVMKEPVYGEVAALNTGTASSDSVQHICLNIVGYMHSAKYLNLLMQRDSNQLNQTGWNRVESVKAAKSWNDILRSDMDETETAPFNALALEHGWDELQFYSTDFDDRNTLLEQWYELEQKSNNAIGMAAVGHLIKALNHSQYKAKKTQTKPPNYDPAQMQSVLPDIVEQQQQRRNAGKNGGDSSTSNSSPNRPEMRSASSSAHRRSSQQAQQQQGAQPRIRGDSSGANSRHRKQHPATSSKDIHNVSGDGADLSSLIWKGSNSRHKRM